ncbi:hypothetical protein RQM47_14695 [Rubrivirga sp. S365]|uniref:DoxX family protein n=1 Tax=Rubrivirga litoralis TaxID=3075598 RepID=A0ABU3BUK9_9BACT|nr:MULTISPECIES: hypothetical protein [unclassified Rubrivirga]MDT0632981.1 hypothetical protein [Rubrivirga sp. F394]MDT7857891.1 hypothetical protein [Rubrivirga sp. S365]
MTALDRLHARAVRSRPLQRFMAVTRVLLAIGFVIPGMTKVRGHRFTSLPTSDPVGYFFDAFFQASEFYAFVGIAQVTAGLLLLWPATATLGAVIYFPIILNIAVITVAVGFQGTWVITVLMTLACLWLLVWDYDRLRAILPARRAAGWGYGAREYALQVGVWSGAGAALVALAAAVRDVAARDVLVLSGLLVVGGAFFGLVVAWHLRHLPAPPALDGRGGAATPPGTRAARG